MRKIFIIAAFTALAATAAFAFQGGMMGYGYNGAAGYGPGYGMMGGGYGHGYGHGPGYGRGYGMGYGPGYGPCWQDGDDDNAQAPAAINESGAKTKAQTYIDKNLKGFKITGESNIQAPRGTVYRFTVKDSNGNNFLVVVNPFGYVRGPIPYNTAK